MVKRLIILLISFLLALLQRSALLLYRQRKEPDEFMITSGTALKNENGVELLLERNVTYITHNRRNTFRIGNQMRGGGQGKEWDDG